MDRIALLNRPLWFVDVDGDIRELVEVFGFLIPERCNYDAACIEGYVDYLCGVSKWEQEGNNFVDECSWMSNLTGETFDYFDPYIQNYLKRARQQEHLTYLVFETNLNLDKVIEGMQDGEFVISRNLYNYILENGVCVEYGCQNTTENSIQVGGVRQNDSSWKAI